MFISSSFNGKLLSVVFVFTLFFVLMFQIIAVSQTANTVPTAPQNVKGIFFDSNVAVVWDTPTSNGGETITGYTVTLTPASGTATTQTVSADQEYAIVAVTNGTAYTTKVYATNSVGNSPDGVFVDDDGTAVSATPIDLTTLSGNPRDGVTDHPDFLTSTFGVELKAVSGTPEPSADHTNIKKIGGGLTLQYYPEATGSIAPTSAPDDCTGRRDNCYAKSNTRLGIYFSVHGATFTDFVYDQVESVFYTEGYHTPTDATDDTTTKISLTAGTPQVLRLSTALEGLVNVHSIAKDVIKDVPSCSIAFIPDVKYIEAFTNCWRYIYSNATGEGSRLLLHTLTIPDIPAIPLPLTPQGAFEITTPAATTAKKLVVIYVDAEYDLPFAIDEGLIRADTGLLFFEVDGRPTSITVSAKPTTTKETTAEITFSASKDATVVIGDGTGTCPTTALTSTSISVTADTPATFSFTALTEGSYSCALTATDSLGNEATAADIDFTVDLTAPTAPTVALKSTSDDGLASDDDITTSTTPTFTASIVVADAVSSVEFFDGQTSLGSVDNDTAPTTATSLDFTVLAASALTVGKHDITAVSKDAAGNETTSAVYTMYVDNSTDTPELTILNTSGTKYILSVKDVTPSADLDVEFHANEALATCTDVLTGGTAYTAGSEVTADATAGGCFVVIDGANNKVAGHTSTAIAGATIALKDSQDTGSADDDLVTNETSLGFTGTSAVGATIDFYILESAWVAANGTSSNVAPIFQDVVVGADGNYSTSDMVFTEGSHRLGFVMTLSGETSSLPLIPSATRLVVDTTPQALVGINTIVIKNVDTNYDIFPATASDNVYSVVDEFSLVISAELFKVLMPTATGGVIKAKIYTDDSDFNTAGAGRILAEEEDITITAGEVTADIAITRDIALTDTLSDGEYKFSVDLTDLAGNTVTIEGDNPFTLDTTDPVLTLQVFDTNKYIVTVNEEVLGIKATGATLATCTTIDNRLGTGASFVGNYELGSVYTLPATSTNGACFETHDLVGYSDTIHTSEATELQGVAAFTITDAGTDLSSNEHTNDTTPAFTATGVPNSTYNIYAAPTGVAVADTHLIATGQADGVGGISGQFSRALADGTYDIYGAVEQAGAEVARVEVKTIVIDTVTPAATLTEFSYRFSVLDDSVVSTNSPVYARTGGLIKVFVEVGEAVGDLDRDSFAVEINGTHVTVLLNGQQLVLDVTALATWDEGPINVVGSFSDYAGNVATFTGTKGTGDEIIFDKTPPTVEIVSSRLIDDEDATEVTIEFADNYVIDDTTALATIDDANSITWTKVAGGEEDVKTVRYTGSVPALGSSATEYQISFTGITVPSDVAGNVVLAADLAGEDLKLYKDTVAPTLNSVGEVDRDGKDITFDINVTHSNSTTTPDTSGVPEIIEIVLYSTNEDDCSLFDGDDIDSDIDYENSFTAADGSSTTAATYEVEIKDISKGNYETCQIAVVDGAGNESEKVSIPEFRYRSSGGGGGSVGGPRLLISPNFTDSIEVNVDREVITEPEQQQNFARVIITRTLQLGSTGSDVKELQKLLNKLGCIVSSTGAGSIGQETEYFGSRTEGAVKCYQAKNGIDTVGIVGPQTRAQINKDASSYVTPTDAPAFEKEEQSREQVRRTIEALIDEINEILRLLQGGGN